MMISGLELFSTKCFDTDPVMVFLREHLAHADNVDTIDVQPWRGAILNVKWKCIIRDKSGETKVVYLDQNNQIWPPCTSFTVLNDTPEDK